MTALTRAIRGELVALLRDDQELRDELRQALGVAGAGDYLTIGKAAAESGFSTRTIARKIRSGVLPAIGAHKATRIRRSDLVRLLESGVRRKADSPEALAELEEADLTSRTAHDHLGWVPRTRGTR